MATEAWLRGPIPGVHPMLMPAAHALVQVREEVPRPFHAAEHATRHAGQSRRW